MSYLAVFIQESTGGFSVAVPALPGCFSQGDTFKRAKKNIEEAIELYLENEDIEDNDNVLQFVASIDIPIHS
jgi:antitoxin HicB